jgi:hypothetical protein
MSARVWKAGLAGAAMVAATVYAAAQMPAEHGGVQGHGMQAQGTPGQGMHDQMMGGPMMQRRMMMDGTKGGMPHNGMGQRMGMTSQPALPGQDAFGTIQEVVRILEADPATDWSKVSIAALREHLIDMNEVTLRAVATERGVDNGIEIAVTGEGRTLEAIKRMIPGHVRELETIGWNASAEELPNGVKLVVTTTDPKQAIKLKAFGFMGIMVQGVHHQLHHLMIAKGEFHVH